MLLKKTEGLQAVRKGYHIQKPGSPSGYQSILTNFEACYTVFLCQPFSLEGCF